MDQETKRKIIGYTRITISDNGPGTQIAAIEAWAKASGTIVAETLIEHAAAGDPHPELKRAFQILRSNPEMAGIAVTSLDRIGPLHLVLSTCQDLMAIGQNLIAIEDHLVLTPTDGAQVDAAKVLSTLHDIERRIASENMRVALAIARLKGRRLGRPSIVTDMIREQVLEMRAAGVPIREIARRIPGISRASIQGILRKTKSERREP